MTEISKVEKIGAQGQKKIVGHFIVLNSGESVTNKSAV